MEKTQARRGFSNPAARYFIISRRSRYLAFLFLVFNFCFYSLPVTACSFLSSCFIFHLSILPFPYLLLQCLGRLLGHRPIHAYLRRLRILLPLSLLQ